MLKFLSRLATICLIGLLTSGCWVAGVGVKSVVVTAVMPVAPPGPPGAQLPVIQLEYDGQRLAGIPSEYAWVSRQAYWTGGSTWSPALSFPGTLTAQVGQTITMVVSAAAPPVTVWVTELDKQGLPIASGVLTATSNAIPYTLSVSGQYVLMTRAYWTRENFVTYLFSLVVSAGQSP